MERKIHESISDIALSDNIKHKYTENTELWSFSFQNNSHIIQRLAYFFLLNNPKCPNIPYELDVSKCAKLICNTLCD